MRQSILYCLFLLIAVTACTNPRWIIQEEQQVDPNDFTEISSREFPDAAGAISAQDPVLRLQIYSETTYEYAEKILMARYVQDYKVRPVFLGLGVLGAGLTFYVANSGKVQGIDGNLEKITLNLLGGIIALSSVANMKPDGEPRPTGEERFLRQTGTRIVKDTVQVNAPVQTTALVDVFYGERPVIQGRSYDISNGGLEIELGVPLSNLGITERNPDSVSVSIQYANSIYTYNYPLDSILQPFARVETSVTELRNTPEESPENVLAELVQGSQLQIIEEAGERWYKVLYGIQENYVLRSDVSRVWRTLDFEQENRVVAIPSLPFGEIDVERNIPILAEANQNGLGLLIGNEEYTGTYPTRKYTTRDVRLVDAYLTEALGYPSDRVFAGYDVGRGETFDSLFTAFSRAATDSSDIFVYLSGFGKPVGGTGNSHAVLLSPAANEASSLELMDLVESITDLPFRKAVVVLDISFNSAVRDSGSAVTSVSSFRQALQNRAASIASRNEKLAIIFSSDVDQSTQTFLGDGEDKKHHIFPYFLAGAMQERLTRISDIYQYLQRNVSYTSRRLHDLPQEPLLFGDQSIDLVQ